MIFLFSTSFTIHGSPRRSENSLEIVKYLHGTCRYRISISLFVNFSIFSMGREGKECPKTCRIFSPINQISTFIYAPLNPPNSPHNQRPNGRTPSPHFDVHACTRSIRLHAYLHRKLLRPKIRRKQQQRYGSLCTHPCTQMWNSCSSRRHTSAPLAKV